LRQKHRKRSRQALEKHYEKVRLYEGELKEDKTISREEMAKIKVRIREELRTERRSALAKSIILTALIIAVVVLTIYLLSRGEHI